MNPLTFRKANLTYFLFFLYFIAGSVGISVLNPSMNLYVLLNELILVAPPVIFFTWKYKRKQSIQSFLRLNPIGWKTALVSMIIPIVMYPVIAGLNACVISMLPSMPKTFDNVNLMQQLNFCIGLLGVGILPGILEEAMFRGILIRGMQHKSKRFAIVYIAFLFGMFHMNPYNFVAPFLLGILLGYLLYTTNSIIPGMIAHATNNTIAVIGVALLGNVQKPTQSTPMPSSMPPSVIVFAVIMVLLLFAFSIWVTRFLFKKLKKWNPQPLIEYEVIEEEKEKRKNRWSYLYVSVPFVCYFLSILFLTKLT
ncbi:type II CAAX endopeptidase family protein (plasmid) [Aneurinibacillus sp. Ricciae_BoGa-3]|uniref:CPBP family intramembrane glutamic endopeptidase n=1 Tax=Aneurinibacillus sp. Ricciae_BoGa-3 TaxID=3022697 RepID=UPI00233FE766|nr:type II CAAX endopeptidase family protein [Aneurinibacillus sp. Ricciae_BoGa-3]WCK57629.1 type II CAAX endopeptidase family protein [Aneurinibacillus sp. Ricciae_BoGa-3]